MKISFTTREDVETLCDDAAATGNSGLLRKVAAAYACEVGSVSRVTLVHGALISRARGIENRLAGRIQAAQAYEDQSEDRIALLPDILIHPFTTEIEP